MQDESGLSSRSVRRGYGAVAILSREMSGETSQSKCDEAWNTRTARETGVGDLLYGPAEFLFFSFCFSLFCLSFDFTVFLLLSNFMSCISEGRHASCNLAA